MSIQLFCEQHWVCLCYKSSQCLISSDSSFHIRAWKPTGSKCWTFIKRAVLIPMTKVQSVRGTNSFLFSADLSVNFYFTSKIKLTHSYTKYDSRDIRSLSPRHKNVTENWYQSNWGSSITTFRASFIFLINYFQHVWLYFKKPGSFDSVCFHLTLVLGTGFLHLISSNTGVTDDNKKSYLLDDYYDCVCLIVCISVVHSTMFHDFLYLYFPHFYGLGQWFSDIFCYAPPGNFPLFFTTHVIWNTFENLVVISETMYYVKEKQELSLTVQILLN